MAVILSSPVGSSVFDIFNFDIKVNEHLSCLSVGIYY